MSKKKRSKCWDCSAIKSQGIDTRCRFHSTGLSKGRKAPTELPILKLAKDEANYYNKSSQKRSVAPGKWGMVKEMAHER